ncbi:hypothetical protein ACTFIW_000807 [Dictyostelium discoideum]
MEENILNCNENDRTEKQNNITRIKTVLEDNCKLRKDLKTISQASLEKYFKQIKNALQAKSKKTPCPTEDNDVYTTERTDVSDVEVKEKEPKKSKTNSIETKTIDALKNAATAYGVDPTLNTIMDNGPTSNELFQLLQPTHNESVKNNDKIEGEEQKRSFFLKRRLFEYATVLQKVGTISIQESINSGENLVFRLSFVIESMTLKIASKSEKILLLLRYQMQRCLKNIKQSFVKMPFFGGIFSKERLMGSETEIQISNKYAKEPLEFSKKSCEKRNRRSGKSKYKEKNMHTLSSTNGIHQNYDGLSNRTKKFNDIIKALSHQEIGDEAIIEKGDLHVSREEFLEAVESYQEAIQCEPQNNDILALAKIAIQKSSRNILAPRPPIDQKRKRAASTLSRILKNADPAYHEYERQDDAKILLGSFFQAAPRTNLSSLLANGDEAGELTNRIIYAIQSLSNTVIDDTASHMLIISILYAKEQKNGYPFFWITLYK